MIVHQSKCKRISQVFVPNPEGLNSRRESVHWACNILRENAKLCGERRPRPHANGCYSSISLHSIDNLNNWAFVVVRYDPMICCVLHARVHPAERHQPTLPPSPWLFACNSSKRLALVYSMQNSRAHVSRYWHASLSTELLHAVARVAEQHRNK